MSWLLQWVGLGRHPFLVTAASVAANFLVQEADGTSKFILEDASGSILLEA